MKLNYSFLLTLCLVFSKFISAQTPSFSWIGSIGGIQSHATAVVVDTVGNVFTTGYFGGTVDFDPTAGVANMTGLGSQDGFLMKQDPAGNLLWSIQVGGAGADVSNAMDIDPAGNVYITGEFRNVVDFDPGAGQYTLATSATSIINMFVMKVTNNGAFVWARQVGDGQHSTPLPHGIALDASGNVFTTGVFKDTTDFDPGPAVFTMSTTTTLTAVFVLKLDNSGNFGWAKQISALDALTIDMDASGNVVTGGTFSSTVDFDPNTPVTPMTAIGTIDAYVLKLSGAGNYLWAKQIGGSGTDIITSLDIDCLGNIVSTGTFSTNLRANPASTVTTFTTFGGLDIFVSKLDNNGNYVWSQQLGGVNGDVVNDLMVDNSGNIYITGSYAAGSTTAGTADFDPGTGTQNLTSVAQNDIYICKLSAAGSYLWAYGMGGTGSDTGFSIYVDKKYSVHTVGDFMNTVDFNPFTPVANQTAIGNPFGVYIEKYTQPLTTQPLNTTPNVFGGMKTCVNGTVTLTASGSATLNWNSVNSSSTSILSGSAFVTPQLTTNTTYYVYSKNLCGATTSLTAITITVNALPSISVTANKTMVCVGEPLTFTATGGITYLWYNGKTGAVITVTTTAAAIYSVVGTNSNSCSNAAIYSFTPAACIGITENAAASGLLIYPNPAKNEFMVESNSALEIIITNEIGQVVRTIKVDAESTTKIQPELKSGIYYISAKGAGSFPAQKLVIIN